MLRQAHRRTESGERDCTRTSGAGLELPESDWLEAGLVSELRGIPEGNDPAFGPVNIGRRLVDYLEDRGTAGRGRHINPLLQTLEVIDDQLAEALLRKSAAQRLRSVNRCAIVGTFVNSIDSLLT